MALEDRDIFGVICIVGGLITLATYFAAYVLQDKRIWGDLRSNNYILYGFYISAIIAFGSLIATWFLIYYHIKPFNWWYLNGTMIFFFFGTSLWYPMSNLALSTDRLSLAGIGVFFTFAGNLALLVGLAHPDTGPDLANDGTESHYRWALMCVTAATFHHFVFDSVIWYISFAHQNMKEGYQGTPSGASATSHQIRRTNPVGIKVMGDRAIVTDKAKTAKMGFGHYVRRVDNLSGQAV